MGIQSIHRKHRKNERSWKKLLGYVTSTTKTSPLSKRRRFFFFGADFGWFLQKQEKQIVVIWYQISFCKKGINLRYPLKWWFFRTLDQSTQEKGWVAWKSDHLPFWSYYRNIQLECPSWIFASPVLFKARSSEILHSETKNIYVPLPN